VLFDAAFVIKVNRWSST